MHYLRPHQQQIEHDLYSTDTSILNKSKTTILWNQPIHGFASFVLSLSHVSTGNTWQLWDPSCPGNVTYVIFRRLIENGSPLAPVLNFSRKQLLILVVTHEAIVYKEAGWILAWICVMRAMWLIIDVINITTLNWMIPFVTDIHILIEYIVTGAAWQCYLYQCGWMTNRWMR